MAAEAPKWTPDIPASPNTIRPPQGASLDPDEKVLPTVSKKSVQGSVPPNPLKEQINEKFSAIAGVLDRHDWAYPLLEDMGAMPKDQESSLRLGVIVTNVIDSWNQEHAEDPIPPDVSDDYTLGTMLSDCGRGDDDPKKMKLVYASGTRWRDDPNAWQWKYVKEHTTRGRDRIAEASGEPRGLPAVIAAQHHNLKVSHPYAAKGEPPFEELTAVQQLGVEFAAAVDVTDAVTRNIKGEGRSYLDDREFEGRTLKDVLQGEVKVSDEVADLAVRHTLLIKGFSETK